MPRPKKKVQCPVCQGAGYVLYSSRVHRGLHLREATTPRETPEQALERIVSDIRLGIIDVTCYSSAHAQMHPGELCHPPTKVGDELIRWLRKHNDITQCRFCGGAGRVHEYRIIEAALKQEGHDVGF